MAGRGTSRMASEPFVSHRHASITCERLSITVTVASTKKCPRSRSIGETMNATTLPAMPAAMIAGQYGRLKTSAPGGGLLVCVVRMANAYAPMPMNPACERLISPV